MSERAHHLAQRVFPEGARVRQWVLSPPFALRVRAAFDHELARSIACIATRAIEARYRRLARAAGLREPRGGAVVVLQRFGSDLRVNLHTHGMHPDGASGLDARGERRFFRPPAPSPAEVEQVLARIVRRVGALLESGLDGDAPDDEGELALAQACAAAAAARGDTETHRPGPRERGVHVPRANRCSLAREAAEPEAP